MPIADDESVYIQSVSARTIEEAKEKFLRKIEYSYDLEVSSDLEELQKEYPEIKIGEIYDVESF